MSLEIRKVVHFVDETWIEGGKKSPTPHRHAAVAVVLKNPWSEGEFVEDLNPGIIEIAPQLAKIIVPRLLELVGGADKVEAFGKSAVVGLNGEIEHGCALIHTLRFGNHMREAINAKGVITSTNKRGGANASITIPLVHVNDESKRSHYMTMEFSVADAPGPNEILIALAAADSGRPHHRIGDRHKDKDLLGIK